MSAAVERSSSNTPQEIRHPVRRISWRVSWGAMVLWSIALVLLAALFMPLAYLIVRAVEADSEAWRGLLRVQTLETIARTMWLAVSVTFASALIAIPIAWCTTRTDLPMRRLWAILTPLPLVIPSYVGAYLMASALGPRGLFQQLLQAPFGITRLPEIYGYPGALITLTLLSYPYILLSARAVLQRMDPALEEASRSLGKNGLETFRRVTFPLLRPALGAGALLVALYVLRDFGAVSIMRYDTFTRVIYLQYRSFDRSQAALLSFALVAMTLIFLALETRASTRARDFQNSAHAVRPPPLITLGRWKWVAFLFCAGVVFFSLILPAGVLVYWLWRGMLAGETVSALDAATWGSVLASGLGALFTVVGALVLAVAMVRYSHRFTPWLERTIYSAHALPGIVVALALVFFGVNYFLPLYQTLPMLLLAYFILFVPQAFGAVRASLLQIHPHLEQAARGLGRSPARVFATITLPLLRPGIIAGASLVFLTAMKELPATLILAPLGFKTLATSVWNAVSEAYFAQAAAPALLIILLSSVPMAFFILREQRVDE